MDELEELRRALSEIRERADLRRTDYAHPCVYALHLLSQNEISVGKGVRSDQPLHPRQPH
jgi:hypothetical protein